MQVQTVNSTNFKSKNTFLKKSNNSLSRLYKDYWKSLHYEAKARLSYKKFKDAEHKVYINEDTGSFCGTLSMAAMIMAVVYRKLQSVIYDTKSYSLFPNRFAEPDDFDCEAKECRYYKIKKGYEYLIKH